MAAASAESAGGTGEVERTAPLRVDAQRNLEHVLRAAREVFGELGYGAPMEDVARRARVGVGTVYRRFPSKDVLVRRIAAEETERLAEQARAALTQEEDPWGAFTRFLRYAVGTGAGRLLPPAVLRAGAAQVTAVTAASRLPQQRQDSLAVVSGEVIADAAPTPTPTPVPTSVPTPDAGRQDAAAHDAALHETLLHEAVLLRDTAVHAAGQQPGQSARLAAEDAAAAGLLDVVGQLVERARLVGKLRADVTVADVLLVIATAAPSLPDATQQAAASARVLEILLDGLRSRAGELGQSADAGVTAAADTASTPVVTRPVEPSPFE